MNDNQSKQFRIGSPLDLLGVLLDGGWRVIGPVLKDGAIVYDQLHAPEQLPRGMIDRQAPGSYSVEAGDPQRWFDYVVGPQNWKRWLMPSREKLWSVRRDGQGLEVEPHLEDWPKTAFFGIRSCDLAALDVLSKVWSKAGAEGAGYLHRRAKTLMVAVQCARSAPTCFCASMETGPHARTGFDLALTELDDGEILLTSGTEAGAAVAAGMKTEAATPGQAEAAEAVERRAAAQQNRHMPRGIATALAENPEAAHWDEVANRCLACANCTLACPTCFCTDVEDTTDLSGDHAERWRVWDSCFNLDFSYIHGGEVRRSVKSRYRQWMTHKLSSWHEQFGTSGCVGCGRCIAWCPVGIDITEEAGAFFPEKNVSEAES